MYSHVHVLTVVLMLICVVVLVVMYSHVHVLTVVLMLICVVVLVVMYSHAHVLTKQLADASFADGAAVVMDTAKYDLAVSRFDVQLFCLVM